MSVPTQEALLERAIDVFDAVAEDRGWGCPPLLIGLGFSDDPGAEVEIAVKEIDEHPAEALLGFSAPASWTAIGVSAEGWAYPCHESGSCSRPGASGGARRERVRSLVLVGRDGRVAGRLRWPDGRVAGDVPSEGLVLDGLRHALNLQA